MPRPWLDVKPLCGSSAVLRPCRVTPRAALIQGVYSRYDRRGTEFGRFGATDLLGKTDDSWQIIAVIRTQP